MTSLTADPEYGRELERARRDQVLESGNLPFYLEPASPRAAVLLVHGFTASPYEMKAFAETMQSAGMAAYALRLPGHGTTPEDLATRTWTEWLSTVDRAHRLLRTYHDTVFGAGMSTGSLLLLAQSLNRRLDGLVLFSPYLQIKHRLSAYAGLLKYVRPYHEVAIPEALQRYYYARRPVAGVAQINRLIRHLTPGLSQVTTPTLAFNSLGDPTIDPVSGRQLVDRLGATVKIHQMVGGDVPHVLTGLENPLRQSMFSLASGFLRTLVKVTRSHE